MKHANSHSRRKGSRLPIGEALAQRILTAQYAICSASWARGDLPEVSEEAIVDLLADLMHFCSAERIDFLDSVRIATEHLKVESDEGGP